MAHKLSIYLNDEEWEFLKDYAKRSRKSDKKFAKDYPDYPQNYEPLTMKNIAPEFKQMALNDMKTMVFYGEEEL